MKLSKKILVSCLSMLAINMPAKAMPVNPNDVNELAKQVQNPVADMATLPFQMNTNFRYGPDNGTQNILNIQPVVPLHVTPDWNIIFRTILPIADQPLLDKKSTYTAGLGDTNFTFFLSPNNPGKLIWGAGPSILAPTATQQQLGTGKWSAGPSAVVLAMPGNWVIGTLAYNLWSFGGQKSREDVNELTVQYFISYNLPNGWYISSSPINTFDWKADKDDRYTIPVGLGVGRVFHIGKQAANLAVQGYDYVKSPTVGPSWSVRTTFTLLFPE